MDTLVLVQSAHEVSPTLRNILTHPGIKGASFALGWDKIETSPGVLDLSLAQACYDMTQEVGKTFEFRFRGGGHTPSWRKGRTWVPTGGTAKGLILPCPFKTDGSYNDTFAQGYSWLFGQLDQWYRARGITRPLHTTWYGGLSAEIFTRADSGITALTGYSYANVLAAYVELIHRGMALTSRVEFPLSGYWEPGFPQDLVAEMDASMWTQANGARDDAGFAHFWPYGNVPDHGYQMVKATPTDGRAYFDWTKVYDYCLLSDATHEPARYLEVYYASFSLSNANQLYAEALAAAGTTPTSPTIVSFPGVAEVDAVGPFLFTVGGVNNFDPAYEIAEVGDFTFIGGGDPVPPDCVVDESWEITDVATPTPADLALGQLIDVADTVDADASALDPAVAILYFDTVDLLWKVMELTTSGFALTVEADDVTVDAAVTTLDFAHGLDATESPDHEINVAVDESELDLTLNAGFADHSARHEDGGADEISLTGLSGTPTAVSDHLADTTDAHDASAISIVDSGNYYTGTEVEAALAELGAAIGGTTIDVEDDNVAVAAASILNFGDNLDVTNDGGGQVTIDAASGTTITFEDVAYWGFD